MAKVRISRAGRFLGVRVRRLRLRLSRLPLRGTAAVTGLGVPLRKDGTQEFKPTPNPDFRVAHPRRNDRLHPTKEEAQ